MLPFFSRGKYFQFVSARRKSLKMSSQCSGPGKYVTEIDKNEKRNDGADEMGSFQICFEMKTNLLNQITIILSNSLQSSSRIFPLAN